MKKKEWIRIESMCQPVLVTSQYSNFRNPFQAGKMNSSIFLKIWATRKVWELFPFIGNQIPQPRFQFSANVLTISWKKRFNFIHEYNTNKQSFDCILKPTRLQSFEVWEESSLIGYTPIFTLVVFVFFTNYSKKTKIHFRHGFFPLSM